MAPGQPLPGAVGLYVPGAGSSASRAGAIASLRRGKVENALLGGKPGGKVVADLVTGPGQAPAVYVQLPPAGTHPNTRRYLVSVDAPGFSGILTSGSTHIDGLVSMTDITQTAVALAEHRKPDIRAVPGTRADLTALDRRLTRVHHDRGWTMFALVLTYAALIAFAPAASVLAPAAAIAASLVLSALGATRIWLVIAAMVGLTVLLTLAGAARRRFIPAVVMVFLVGYLIALAASPETNALAVLGARPDGGGRFYGIGNQLETLLLVPVIAAVAVGGLAWLLPIGILALVTVGWSKAGADGGGLVVFAAAFAVLLARLSPGPLSWRRLALVGVGAVAVVFALIGIDAALGGSSHVTHSVGSGSLFGDFWRRLHLSWASVTRAWYSAALFLGCATVLVWVAVRRTRYASVDAMLVAVVVSLLVNDTPVDVILLGTLGCLALLRFESVDSRPMRVAALTVVCAAALFALAGCGSTGVKRAAPNTVVGTVQQESPGKAIFAQQGCGSCHTFTPAGPDARGNIGPNLDNLAQYAKQANQPLKEFVSTSIAHPEAYIQPGYPKNVMPKTYGTLPAQDLKDLVDFLTTPQG
ncbi:MAG TPA: c-type cytochrome [Gaiellaceae bacterium]|nr:c-type cytochrome [Gaiellaceae bacterium]